MVRQILKTGLLVGTILVVVACGAQPTAAPTATQPPAVEPTATERATPTAAPTEAPTAAPTEAVATIWSSKPVVLGTCCEPSTIDPATALGAWISFQVLNSTYEGLTRYNRSGEIEPWLATSWEISDDAMTYTFKLREGVKFHDGTEFNAEAVKMSFDRMKAMQLGVSYLLDSMSEVKVVDEMTVQITLSEPDIAFWFGVPRVMIISPTALAANEKNGDWAADFFRENMVGTGPYRMTRWDAGRQLELVAFEDYWRGWEGRHLKKFIVRFGLEYSSRLLQLEEGEAMHIIDWAGLSDARRAAKNPDIDLYKGSPMIGFYHAMNTQAGPLQDRRVRQAMMLAFPYEELLTVMEGFAEPLTSPATSEMIGYCKVFEPKQDLEKARELLVEAGYPDGFQVKQAYKSENENRRLAAELFQEVLAELGVEVVLDDIKWGQFMQAEKQSETAYDFTNWTTGPVIPYAGTHLFDLGHSSMIGATNFSFYDNPEFDALLEEARHLPPGDPKLDELLCEAQKMLIEDAVVIPLMLPQYLELRRTELHSPEFNPYGFYYDMELYDMYLEE